MGGLGGALRIFAAVLWLDGSECRQNLAGSVGGAMFLSQSCALVGCLCLVHEHAEIADAIQGMPFCAVKAVKKYLLNGEGSLLAGWPFCHTLCVPFVTAVAETVNCPPKQGGACRQWPTICIPEKAATVW